MIIPVPKYEPTEEDLATATDAHVRWFMNVAPWICPKCGTKMHGRMEYCVYCKLRKNEDVPRPGKESQGTRG